MIKDLNLDNLMDGLFGGDIASAASTQNQATEDNQSSNTSNKIVMLGLNEIYDKPNHTFTVNREAPDWSDFVSSIRLYGVQTPILVRYKPCEVGTYECIAGHRRRAGSQEAGKPLIPAIITEATDSEANILMIITNKQRPRWTISETAYSWKELYCELKRQGQRTDLVKSDNKSAEELMEELSGQDIRSVQRTIKLCDLISPILSLLDSRKMPTGIGYQLSFLSVDNQAIIYNLIENYGMLRPDDAQHFRNLESSGGFTENAAEAYILSRKSPEKPFKLTEKEIKSWFPPAYSGDRKALIKHLLDNYFASQQ